MCYNIKKFQAGKGMTLQQLKYIVTVAQTGTITEAAGKLYISQPSLTNAIHELEKEMNITNEDSRRNSPGVFACMCRRQAKRKEYEYNE